MGREDRLSQFEALRPQLFALAYRMLGTRAEAEDVLQDAFLKWDASTADVQNPKGYLMATVSRLSLDALGTARHRRETYVGVWLPEPLAGERPPDETLVMTESLSMAFLFLLESLTPPERVAFLLREVFDYEYSEIASILTTTETNCRQLVSRARKSVRDGRPRFDIDPKRHQTAIARFTQAIAQNDVPGLLSVLSPDVIAYSDGGGEVAAARRPIQGPDRVVRFFLGLASLAPAQRITSEVRPSAGAPALWVYAAGRLISVLHVSLDEDGRIASLYSVLSPQKLPTDGAPA